MPQMSPLFWVILMLFFVLLYLLLSVVLYFKFYLSGVCDNQRSRGVKFFLTFGW